MKFPNPFRRAKPDTEIERRTRLLQHGRIAEGTIIDVGMTESADDDDDTNTGVIYYAYAISGVDYQSSQTLNPEQQQRQLDYSPGASITVRYDPRQPANSVVV